MLTSPQVLQRDLVSKNVCHGIAYDQALHARLLPERTRTAGLDLIVSAMERYLRKRPEGKLLHDPLAACVLLCRDLAELREVEVYRESGKWGSRQASGTGCFITVAIDRERFVRVLLGDELPLPFEG
jgi:pyrimidine-specific ribonucleoside hydrolase